MTATAVAGLLQKPINGGLFGHGRYALASMPCVARGLHSIQYMVVEPQGGAVLSVADDKIGALAGARRLLAATIELEDVPEQLELGLVAPPQTKPAASAPATVRTSRRRREIYDRCEGRCHYCRTPLTLDGRWHVEHMQPRALGGNDNPLNLVAACVPCNLAKSDRTALEFVAQRAAP
jgi:hypothetical protein